MEFRKEERKEVRKINGEWEGKGEGRGKGDRKEGKIIYRYLRGVCYMEQGFQLSD